MSREVLVKILIDPPHTWPQIWNTPKRWTKLSNFSSGPPGHESPILLHMYIWENKAQLSQSPHQWHPPPRALLLTPHVLYCICNVHIRIHTSSSTLTPQSRSDRECDGLSGLSGPLTADYFYWLLLILSQYWLLTADCPQLLLHSVYHQIPTWPNIFTLFVCKQRTHPLVLLHSKKACV